ncbi:MAG: formyltransferase family protein [Candidatus Eisenbacteria bacterium]
MRAKTARFGILASTGGAVLGKLIESPWFRAQLALVAVDRPCGALERASAAGLSVALCTSDDAAAREVMLAEAFERHRVEHVFVFYTRLLRHALLERFTGRLWNLHPTLLPAFPGAHGFEDSIAAHVPVLGSTLHAIDAGLDTGPVLMQAAFPRVPGMTAAQARHEVFTQHVRMTLQAARWLAEGRVRVDRGRVVLRHAPPPTVRDHVLFAPGFDDQAALSHAVPSPRTTEAPR